MRRLVEDTTHVGLALKYEVTRVYADIRTAYQHVLIAETRAFGRALFMDGVLMSTEADEGLYHSALVHPGLFTHGRPAHVLIGGGGEGATLREVLRHPSVESVTMVDIDEEAVRLCRQHLGAWHRGAFDDPRVRLSYRDVREVLSESRAEAYDAIVLDLGDPASSETSVPAATVEFYRLVRRALRRSGIAALQAGEYLGSPSSAYASFIATLCAAFPHVRPYRVAIPSFCSVWGFALVAERALPRCPEDLEQRFQQAGGSAFEDYDPEGHRAWMWLSRRERRALGAYAPVFTDARPLELG